MVLGLTLAMLGLPAVAMGLAVHAVTPEKRLRQIGFLGGIHQWFTFDKAMIAAGLVFLPGLASDLVVLFHWLAVNRGPLTPWHTRLVLAGGLFIAMGFQIALLGLLVGATRNALTPALLPPGPVPQLPESSSSLSEGTNLRG
jgi:hypothetical protein